MKSAIEVILNGMHLWIYVNDLNDCWGALMLTPTHDQDTFGLGISYAHLFEDGIIRRFNKEIGKLEDLIYV